MNTFKLIAAALILPALAVSISSGCSLSPTFDPADIPPDITVQRTGGYIALRPGSKILSSDAFPDSTPRSTGFIFYPGGLVEPDSYIPMLSYIVTAGYEVFIVPMPLDLAVFAPNSADKVIAAESKSSWVIAGHSLGGAMAAQYAAKGKAAVQGLVLMAAYPAENNPLTAAGIPVLSIYAGNDGLCTPYDIEDSRTRLPSDAEFYEIPGGNHAQFGSYGVQKGDGLAAITEAEQQRLTGVRVVEFLQSHF